MTNNMREIDPEEITDNPFRLIGRDWMLIAAGTRESFNMMTASWGWLGILWDKKIAGCVVRPTRHTYRFMEESPSFSLSFLDQEYRDALTYCGTHSGRDVNKAAEAGLTPIFDERGVWFAEARLVLFCTKIYYDDIEPRNFLFPEIDDCYPQKDYHRIYLGEIVKCLTR